MRNVLWFITINLHYVTSCASPVCWYHCCCEESALSCDLNFTIVSVHWRFKLKSYKLAINFLHVCICCFLYNLLPSSFLSLFLYRIMSIRLQPLWFFLWSSSQPACESVDWYTEWQSDPRWLTSSLNPERKHSAEEHITSCDGHLTDKSFMSIIILQRGNEGIELMVGCKNGTVCKSELQPTINTAWFIWAESVQFMWWVWFIS